MRHNQIHIGIDLDNTTICYDDSFYSIGVDEGLIPHRTIASKSEIKSYLTSLPNGQFHWERLQGLVYGKRINEASLFNGVLKFIDNCYKTKGIAKVSIVSHKTILAHHDPDRTNLHNMALIFLKDKGIISESRLSINDIIFCGTMEDKINKISELNCDIFIDDLAKIFEHPFFPKDCKPILFRDHDDKFECYSSWEEINRALFA